MNVSAIIVTRGDVDLHPILDSLPPEWEGIVWNNGEGRCGVGNWNREDARFYEVPDLSVYGRYAAIEYASHDLVYTQDDDVIVSDPAAITQRWEDNNEGHRGGVICNMPQEFRPHYTDSALVGFGAAFHRDAPARAFEKFWERYTGATWDDLGGEDFYRRTCDVVFTTLTPRVLVDVPKKNLPYAEGPDRMYRQASHVGERTRMLELARRVRDA